MLSYAEHGDWIIPIVRVVANREEGIGELLDRIDQHRAYLESSGRLVGRRLERSRHQIVESVRAELVRRYLTGDGAGKLEQLAQLVADRELDPHSAAEQIIASTVEQA